MRKTHVLPLILLLGLVAAGCGPQYATHPTRQAGPRAGAAIDGRTANVVRHDAREHVRHMSHYVRLNNQQARQIERVLVDRTFDLLHRTPPNRQREVYPFPRPHHNNRGSVAARWWRDTDRVIERHLTREQARAYRDLAEGRYADNRGKGNKGRGRGR